MNLKEMREEARKAQQLFERTLKARQDGLRPNQAILVCQFCDNVTTISAADRASLLRTFWSCPCSPDEKQPLLFGTKFMEPVDLTTEIPKGAKK